MISMKKILKRKKKEKPSKQAKEEAALPEGTDQMDSHSVASGSSSTEIKSRPAMTRGCSVPVLSSTTNTGNRSPPAHARNLTLTDGDFEGLLIKSRGWVYDPLDPVAKPHHKTRGAMAEIDFDRYIFKKET